MPIHITPCSTPLGDDAARTRVPPAEARTAVEVRRATERDLHEVLALLEAQYDDHAIEFSRPTLAEATQVLMRDQERGAILLAFAPKAVGVAVLSYAWALEYGGRVAWLDELFVHPDLRDQGIGRDLLRAGLSVAKEAACRSVHLEVALGHARAEHLYHREDFHPVARQRWSRTL